MSFLTQQILGLVRLVISKPNLHDLKNNEQLPLVTRMLTPEDNKKRCTPKSAKERKFEPQSPEFVSSTFSGTLPSTF